MFVAAMSSGTGGARSGDILVFEDVIVIRSPGLTSLREEVTVEVRTQKMEDGGWRRNTTPWSGERSLIVNLYWLWFVRLIRVDVN